MIQYNLLMSDIHRNDHVPLKKPSTDQSIEATNSSMNTQHEAQLKELNDKLTEKERQIDLLEQEASYQEVDEVEDVKLIEATPRLDDDTNTKDDAPKKITRGTQTINTGESNRQTRKQIRSLKRQLKAERSTRDLISLVSMHSFPQQKQFHQQQLEEQQSSKISYFTKNYQEKAEQQHYERTRTLLDAHAQEISLLKEQQKEEREQYEYEYKKNRKEKKKQKKNINNLRSVVQHYKNIVEASQAKALELCKDAFEQLELEQTNNQTLVTDINQLQNGYYILEEKLSQTNRLLETTKQNLLNTTLRNAEERNRFNNVMNVLAETSTSEATRGLQFSQLKGLTKPKYG